MELKSSKISKEKLATCLEDIACRAGYAAMKYWNAGDVETNWKKDGTPVTKADLEADKIIQQGLKSEFSSIPVVSEESTPTFEPSEDPFFIVDPIDGTKGFRKGSPEFTVNIALVENGTPQAGVVFAPALNRMFISPCFGHVIEKRGSITKQYKKLSTTSGPLRVVVSKSYHWKKLEENFQIGMQADAVNVIYSSLKFCLLAVGEADLYPRFGRTMEWDTAAGHAILRAVGGSVLNLTEKQPLKYGKPNYINSDFVAMVPSINLYGE